MTRWQLPGEDGSLVEDALALCRAELPETALPDARARALLADGRYRLAIATADGRLAGMALVAVFPAERFLHLDYLATAPAARGRGVASSIIQLALRDLGPAPAPELLTLESGPELFAFYTRRGARLLAGVPYLFPRAGLEPVPMALLAFGHAPAPSLPGARVREIVRALYRAVHGRGADDEVLRSFIDRVPADVRLVEPAWS